MEEKGQIDMLRERYLAEISLRTPPQSRHDMFMLRVYRTLLRDLLLEGTAADAVPASVLVEGMKFTESD